MDSASSHLQAHKSVSDKTCTNNLSCHFSGLGCHEEKEQVKETEQEFHSTLNQLKPYIEALTFNESKEIRKLKREITEVKLIDKHKEYEARPKFIELPHPPNPKLQKDKK